MEVYDALLIASIVIGIAILFSLFVTVRQGNIGVVTIFGKYRRILRPGLNMRVPIIEVIHSRVLFKIGR